MSNLIWKALDEEVRAMIRSINARANWEVDWTDEMQSKWVLIYSPDEDILCQKLSWTWQSYDDGLLFHAGGFDALIEYFGRKTLKFWLTSRYADK